MTLDDYLNLPGAMSATDFARQLNLNPDQVRQWRHLHAGRRPSPENCVAIEQATGGRVTRRDMRPDDWQRIWPELVTAAPVAPKRPPKLPKLAPAAAGDPYHQTQIETADRIEAALRDRRKTERRSDRANGSGRER